MNVWYEHMMASGTDLLHRILCAENQELCFVILKISEMLQICSSFHAVDNHTECPTSLFVVWFWPFNENSWILHRKSCWWKVILPFMLSEDHSVFRNTESKILGFSMILEHPLDATVSNIRTHFIMTNSDTVGIFPCVI